MAEPLPESDLNAIDARWRPDSTADRTERDAVRDVGRLVDEVRRLQPLERVAVPSEEG